MKKKIVEQFEYAGLGFPILLLNISLIEVRGVEVPDVDYNLLQKNVLSALGKKPTPLTGNEVRFIRQYFQMNYTEFANAFGVTHASVIHWENSKNNFARITPTTELCIRLHILDYLHADNKSFRKTFKTFDFSKFKKQKSLSNIEYLEIDLDELASA
jgi:transcriptional regulator with XRE-family HTH domain